MIQFKEKAVKQGENVNVGLLDYPVLMAADILIANRWEKIRSNTSNSPAILQLGLTTTDSAGLKLPEPLIRSEGARVMSLTDGTQKCPSLTCGDEPNQLVRTRRPNSTKIKRCKTDYPWDDV